MLVRSGKFSNEHGWAKESHSESASSWGLWCVGGLGAAPFAAVIHLHTSAELMLLFYMVIQNRFLT